MNKKSVA